MSIKRSLKRLLKTWPAFYRTISKIYFVLQPVHLAELIIGTKAREKEWAERHLYKGNDWGNNRHAGNNDEWVMGYWDSQGHNHRHLLLEKIASYSPNSILEIGCNCGPNLYLIAKQFPSMKIEGIDINPKAIELGRELLISEGISNVKLSIGKADELEQFNDKEFDIVFTDAVLIYIGKDKIRKVIQEMLRVARKAVILMEWHSFTDQSRKDPAGLGFYHHGGWERNYSSLLEQLGHHKRITINKITKDVWPDEIWSKVGAVIEVAISQQ